MIELPTGDYGRRLELERLRRRITSAFEAEAMLNYLDDALGPPDLDEVPPHPVPLSIDAEADLKDLLDVIDFAIGRSST